MTAPKNVELAREGYERMAREGITAIFSFVHEDIQIDEDRGFVDAGTFHGHDGVLKLYGMFTEQFDDFRMIPVGVFPGAENKVMVAVRLTGIAKTTRIPLQLESFHVHTVVNGRSHHMRVFLSRTEALQDAGLDDVALIRELYAAIRPGRLTEMFEFLAPDVEWHEWKTLPNARVLHGHDGLRPYLETLADGYASFEFEPRSFREEGGTIVVETRFSGEPKGGGEPVSVEVVHVWELDDGRVRRMQVFGDLDEALAEVTSSAGGD